MWFFHTISDPEIRPQIIIHPMSSIFAVTKALTQVYDVLAKKGTTRDDLDSLADFRGGLLF